MYAAYDRLSVPIKILIDGLSAEHSLRYVFGEAKASDVIHLMVIKHPLLGRPALYVNPQFTTKILGQSGIESVGLLKKLFDHCLRPDKQYRVCYGSGDIATVHIHATWHKAINDYQGHRRLTHPITVEDCELLENGSW